MSQAWPIWCSINAPSAPNSAINAKVRTPPNNSSASRFRSRSRPKSKPSPRAAPKRSAKSRSNILESLTCLQSSFGRCQFFQLCIAHFWIFKIKRVQCIDDRGSDNDAREPFIVRGDDIPGRPFRGGIANHVFISVHVVIPVFSFFGVIGRKFPVFFWLLDALEEALLLLLVRDVKEELSDQNTVAR